MSPVVLGEDAVGMSRWWVGAVVGRTNKRKEGRKVDSRTIWTLVSSSLVDVSSIVNGDGKKSVPFLYSEHN